MKLPLIKETILEVLLLVEIEDNVWRQFEQACKDQGEDPKDVLTLYAKSYVIGNIWEKQAKVKTA